MNFLSDSQATIPERGFFLGTCKHVQKVLKMQAMEQIFGVSCSSLTSQKTQL